MMNRLRNSASPASTWLGGVCWRPSALRVRPSTTRILVKLVQVSRIAGSSESRVSPISIVTDVLGLSVSPVEVDGDVVRRSVPPDGPAGPSGPGASSGASCGRRRLGGRSSGATVVVPPGPRSEAWAAAAGSASQIDGRGGEERRGRAGAAGHDALPVAAASACRQVCGRQHRAGERAGAGRRAGVRGRRAPARGRRLAGAGTRRDGRAAPPRDGRGWRVGGCGDRRGRA